MKNAVFNIRVGTFYPRIIALRQSVLSSPNYVSQYLQVPHYYSCYRNDKNPSVIILIVSNIAWFFKLRLFLACS